MTSVVVGRRRPYACAWCGRQIVDSERGRRRKYCKQSCRQRAYEQRTLTEGTSIPDDAVILASDEIESFRDRLFELRCAAEDLATAVAEGASAAVVESLRDDVLERATQAERFR
ncbi:hypothetical protein [Gordonia sp. CPCC 205333]|uniref:hypothetical protein n=1 Tax=Gordonia sp. CPCC 205333 TaxID=3140790 RepID=UPI003AF404FE